jgi:hypothetical protein
MKRCWLLAGGSSLESMMVFGVTPENSNIRLQGNRRTGEQDITVGVMWLGPGVDGVNVSVGVDEHGENGEHFSAAKKNKISGFE